MNTDDGEYSYYYNLIKTAIKVREPPFEILCISVTHESSRLRCCWEIKHNLPLI